MNSTYSIFRKFLFPMLVCCFLCGAGPASAAQLYAVAKLPTPMFNVPDIAGIFGGKDGGTLLADSCGQLRQLEFIALPGTVFTVTGTFRNGSTPVYRVTTAEYPYPSSNGFYIDSRFVTVTETRPPDRPRVLPSRRTVMDRLLAAQGSIYVWGGNIRSGIPQMQGFFPPRQDAPLAGDGEKRWELRGVDCSGLLYEATGGYTPRNTSTLVNYGKGVPIAGLTTDDIIRSVEPLDLIVWNGHVQIILDGERVIESYLGCQTGGGGVRVRPLREALAEIRKKRAPLDNWQDEPVNGKKGFVIRRWFGSEVAGRPTRE